MKHRANPEHITAALILLLGILTLHFAVRPSVHRSSEGLPRQHQTFVEVAGAVEHPGVYGFSGFPRLGEIIERAGLGAGIFHQGTLSRLRFHSGTRIVLLWNEGRPCVRMGEMTAFYKMTLGIPVSIDHENAGGLTALPGIGSSLAAAIVKERSERNGFRSLEDLLSIPGINRGLFKKIRPYIRL